MKIVEINEQDKALYNKLAMSHGTVFNTIEWTDLFGKKMKCYGFYNDNNFLIGGFALYKERKFGVSIYRNPPFTAAIGPFLKVDAQNEVSIMDKWKDVLSLMAEFIDHLHYSVLSISFNFTIVDAQPLIWRKFKIVPGYTYLIDLNQSVEDLWKKISKVRKNEIKKAELDGVDIKLTDDYQLMKKLVLKTFSRQKKGIDEYYLNKILFEFANKRNSYSFVAFKRSAPIAGTFVVYHNNIAHALIGGYDHDMKHRGAGPSVDWECIKYAKMLGLRLFDFEGSMIPRVEKYLRGFGGALTPYHTVNKAIFPFEVLLKFIRRERF